MTTLIQDIDGYATAEDTLNYMSKALNNKLNRTVPSTNPASDYKRLDAAIRKLLDAKLALAAKRLQQINAATAASGMAEQVKDAADKAKKEADRIKKATKIVNELVAFVDDITSHVGLVGKILAL